MYNFTHEDLVIVQWTNVSREDRYTDEDRKKRVENNVAHLELLKARTDWKGDEDWSAIDKAITDCKSYLGE